MPGSLEHWNKIKNLQIKSKCISEMPRSLEHWNKIKSRDVTTGATGATAVAPKFSDTLTLSQPRGADSAHHYRGRS